MTTNDITSILLSGDDDLDYQAIRLVRDEFERKLRNATGDFGNAWGDHEGSNTYNWVTDRLAIGGDEYLLNHNVALRMAQEGVTHSLDCRGESWGEEAVPNGVVYLRNGTGDDGKSKDAAYFKRSIVFGLAAFADGDAKLYVHCAAGINRGPSSGYAVLRAAGLTAPEAWLAIRSKRPCAAIEYAYDAEIALFELGYTKEVFGA